MHLKQSIFQPWQMTRQSQYGYFKDQICTLLKGIETGNEASVAVVNPDKYIQHNPQTHEGGEGLAQSVEERQWQILRLNLINW